MVDAGLSTLRAAKASRRDACQSPPVVEEDDEWSSRVADTRVLPSILVSGTKHLREDLEINASRVVPGLALVVLDDGDVDLLQESSAVTIGKRGIRLSPSRHDSVPAFERDRFRWQTDGQDVVRVVSCFVQLQDRDVVAIRMRSRESEVGMKSNLSHGEELRGFVLEPLVLDVVGTDDDGQLLQRSSFFSGERCVSGFVCQTKK